MGKNNKKKKQKLNGEFENIYNKKSLNQFIPSYDPKKKNQNQNQQFLNNPPEYFPQQQPNPLQNGIVYAQVPSNVPQSQQKQLNSNNQCENGNHLQQQQQPQYGLGDFQNIIPPPEIYHHSLYKQNQEHVIPAVILFVAGFFFIIPWIVNVIYLKSKSRIARGLAIFSVILFSMFLLLVLIVCITIGLSE
ncbi:hypothetical protein DDB_G0281143 [Dictyostelium discoideum AX4]|uniref:Transmembrane protein n=1 Tax=Dictyostelium discoideum TaxID=44689 RepID=Q54UD5_DICDI|nr:hypothetical protein DDB_G0281143 [Dictyostelium discoideum AX4]EAL66868.1 hypothetical protein DDB_G0281143 [Dictyostelium discoideum AX4]|eukprot:XP_640841.1 hypothetical protein DDB_G0281143 [Dictyostelium discoideum AX4]